jgi:hypothetical protein
MHMKYKTKFDLIWFEIITIFQNKIKHLHTFKNSYLFNYNYNKYVVY